jgi:hypothetical protein
LSSFSLKWCSTQSFELTHHASHCALFQALRQLGVKIKHRASHRVQYQGITPSAIGRDPEALHRQQSGATFKHWAAIGP